MIKFRFPNVIAGYLGIKQEQQTLNSSFYAELFGKQHDMDMQIIVPQRVPKKEFFDELLLLEENTSAESLINHRAILVEGMYGAFDLLKENYSKQRCFLNWLNILIRYGLFNEVWVLDSNQIKPFMNESNFIEFELIKTSAYFRIMESEETLKKCLINLANIVLSGPNLSKRIQVLVLNYVVVSAYRFLVELPYECFLKACCEKLIDLLKDESDNDFGTLIRCSVAYRGLAMVNELGTAHRTHFLNQAEYLARNVKISTKFEELLAKENLYTCLQSQSKWNQQFANFATARSNLAEMIRLDPYDSTGYAELGFFLLAQNCIEEASVNFARAVELGPPAVGMHTYYYAKSLQLLGNNQAAISALYKVTQLDKEALSPWLDLIELHLKTKATNQAKEIITLVLKDPTYRSQLETEEISQLEAELEKL